MPRLCLDLASSIKFIKSTGLLETSISLESLGGQAPQGTS